MLTKFCFTLLLIGLASADSQQYDGYKVYETIPRNEGESDFLHKLSEMSEDFDFWTLTRIANRPVHVMVSPRYQSRFEQNLSIRSMDFKILIPNVADTIKKEHAQNTLMRSLNYRIGFTQYHRYSEIDAYLTTLAKQYPNIVTVKEVGKSFEGRSMKTITVSNGVKNPEKSVIFVDAGIHAREWIAPAEALYIIHQLVEKHSENKDLLQNYDWVILPLVNPDGYEYSHSKSRYWRKTRSSGSFCVGTDGNRNFDFKWATTGSSSYECADDYHGVKSFSETETQIVRDILLSFKGRCKFYLTMHSYGNYLLYPWGWTSSLPDTWKDLDEVAQAGADAIYAATRTDYLVGSSTNVLYAAAGGSDDYAFGVAKVPIAITLELPSGGKGGFEGFDPDVTQIKDIVAETWIGVRAMAKKVQEKYT